jgi:hypothetical protein
MALSNVRWWSDAVTVEQSMVRSTVGKNLGNKEKARIAGFAGHVLRRNRVAVNYLRLE